MNFSNVDILREFWISFNLAYNKEDFQNVLIQSKINCMELLESLEGDEYSTISNESPLFAIISEVHRVCPEAVEELAATDPFFELALSLFSTYSEEKRNLLRDTFLKNN